MAQILLIEDNPSNIKLATIVLEALKHDIVEVGTAVEGIRLAEQLKPDLILMDIQLPGMDGLEATRLLKQNPLTKDIKIIAVTAFIMKGDEARILAAGCDGYIAKPIEFGGFIDCVARHLPSES